MTEYGDLLPTSDEITSTANPRVKWLASLRKRRSRDAEGVTVVEGLDELSLAVEAGVRVQALYYCRALMRGNSGSQLFEALAAQGTEVVLVGEAAFAKASYRESPDGWLAVVPDPSRPLGALRLSERPLLLVAESVEKPGNLGAMLRTADAARVDAVVAASPVSDWGNPNVVRASKGAVFAVPVASAPSAEVAHWLTELSVTTVVATPESDRLFTDLDLTGAVAIVVGAEHAGVSDTWHSSTDVTCRIPMAGRVNSLNVATSAALVLYEAVRQRNADVQRLRQTTK
ncbi:MAG: TrmH family RNA methyltransferase [Nocardioidaceae bacterium]